ncbi:hypothetical protein HMPREF1587_00130 [Bifidobacterium breve JCP7499]|nr:hypothetical protein HMPREF1587_00130 [Bifidobacterium breve JCP7499]
MMETVAPGRDARLVVCLRLNPFRARTPHARCPSSAGNEGGETKKVETVGR